VCRLKAGADGARRRNEGQLVANWVDVCGRFICAGQLPERWPHTIAVASQNFRIKSGANRGRGFHVLAAVGREQGEPGSWAPTPRLWRVEPFAGKDLGAWEAFFRALDGAPEVIISDADNALTLAIQNVFGEQVEHRLCEWHLGRKLREHLPPELLQDGRHPIVCTLPEAFRSPENWRRLERAIDTEHTEGQHGPLPLAVRWMQTYGQRAKTQIATRHPNGINSTGPVEQALRELERRIGNRVGSFTNRARLAKRLDLITLDMTGKADSREWADQLREHLYLAGGRPQNQRPHDDPKGFYSLFS
jgi:hypothetical protein